jgi:hypothetical protein
MKPTHEITKFLYYLYPKKFDVVKIFYLFYDTVGLLEFPIKEEEILNFI